MTTATKWKVDHIFLRPNSKYWRVRLQMDGRSAEKSLGTTDRDEAVVLAGPLIIEHRARLLAARAPEGVRWQSEHPPGLHDGPDGGKIFATDRELPYMEVSEKVTIKGPNDGLGGLRFALLAPDAHDHSFSNHRNSPCRDWTGPTLATRPFPSCDQGVGMIGLRLFAPHMRARRRGMRLDRLGAALTASWRIERGTI
jgi:hypothetical protein